MPDARIGRAVLLVLALSTLAAADPREDPEYLKAATTILCDCGCHPQSVHDCACGRAEEMRGEIAGLIGQGLNGEQVIQRYVAQRGEQIRIAPVAHGFNLVAWLGPLLAMIGASAAVAYVVLRWSRIRAREGEPPTTAPGPETPDDAAYRRRLDAAVEDTR